MAEKKCLYFRRNNGIIIIQVRKTMWVPCLRNHLYSTRRSSHVLSIRFSFGQSVCSKSFVRVSRCRGTCAHNTGSDFSLNSIDPARMWNKKRIETTMYVPRVTRRNCVKEAALKSALRKKIDFFLCVPLTYSLKFQRTTS